MSHQHRDPLRGILSGGITGAIEICITYPTEYVKTMMQLYAKYSKGGVKFCINETYSKYGVLGFYRGLTPLLTFSIPQKAARFGSNEWLKNNVFTQKTRLHTFLGGLGAGIFEAIVVVTPAETMKVKLIHDRLSAEPKYKGMFHGIGSIIREQGIGATYKGLLPTIIKQGSNQGIRFLVYEEVKNFLKATNKLPELACLLIGGGVAGGASVLANTPVDVIKTQMQGLKAEKYSSTWDCVKTVFREEGIRGFYKGTVPRLGRVVLDVAITFSVYDYILRGLDYAWPPKGNH